MKTLQEFEVAFLEDYGLEGYDTVLEMMDDEDHLTDLGYDVDAILRDWVKQSHQRAR